VSWPTVAPIAFITPSCWRCCASSAVTVLSTSPTAIASAEQRQQLHGAHDERGGVDGRVHAGFGDQVGGDRDPGRPQHVVADGRGRFRRHGAVQRARQRAGRGCRGGRSRSARPWCPSRRSRGPTRRTSARSRTRRRPSRRPRARRAARRGPRPARHRRWRRRVHRSTHARTRSSPVGGGQAPSTGSMRAMWLSPKSTMATSSTPTSVPSGPASWVRWVRRPSA
jgi:hypothetical protein